jgi:pyridoxine 4-dehydrogenase
VKGGANLADLVPDASPASLRRSVTAINDALGGFKRLDLFECARVDPKVPIEESIGTLKGLIEEGLFDFIGLSECKAETLRRANKVHPITAVEIEVSLFSYEEETKKGECLAVAMCDTVILTCVFIVIAAAGELGVAVIGYSPIGRGFVGHNIFA